MRALLLRSLVIIAAVTVAAPASAQVDPFLFMKTAPPNVVFVVDTANRMQRDAPSDNTDLSHVQSTSNYYDPLLYPLDVTKVYQTTTLNINATNTTAFFRRKYTQLTYSSNGTDKFNAGTIAIARDQAGTAYTNFDAPTRLAMARAAMYQAVLENSTVAGQTIARFGLVRMRQKNPAPATQGDSGPVVSADPSQEGTGIVTERSDGKWNISRPTVDANNGAQASSNSGLMIKADSATATSDVLSILARDVRQTSTGTGASQTLIPAGNDDANTVDAPVNYMLDDALTEVTRLIAISNDPICRNTVVVLIVGGGEGTTAAGVTNDTLGTTANSFRAISGRRVPIYVIAIAPPVTDRAGLQAVATNSGGQYFEITAAQINMAFSAQSTTYPSASTGTVVVPEIVSAINVAVSHTFASSADFNALPTTTLPFGPSTEYQVTSPIIGTVDLTSGRGMDKSGTTNTIVALTNTQVYDKAGALIPQRSNIMVTTGLSVPTTTGMGAKLRAFRVYEPVADSTQLSGWKFKSSGQRLWIACVPGPGCKTSKGDDVSDPNQRNLYTVTPDGTMIAFTTSNVATLAPLMNLNATDATDVITAVRNLPLGPIVDSTPAIMNPPSLDPPPDDAYPGFANANKGRRSIVWAGTNYGILEGIDARLGVEAWGFIPLNLLPKLKTLRDGQPIGKFDFFMDGSAKISDVRLAGICDPAKPSECWRTHLIIGEGPGGNFYQSFDVTMNDMGSCALCASSSDDINAVLGYFADASRIKLNWAFPSYASFDPAVKVDSNQDPIQWYGDRKPYGDLKSSATAIEKTVGQSWSDPAVGQIVSTSGPFAVLVGSGFSPYSKQQQTNRGGTVAGTTFYVLDAKTGSVLASKDVGSDGLNETVDNCRTNSDGCKKMKNALQSDPVATGPSDSRFVTKTYVGDLDGNLWRFDIALDTNSNPVISTTTKLYSSGSDQPIFNSMATVNVGGTQQYVFFGTGGDLLPGTDKNTINHLLGVLDNGASGSKTFDQALTKNTQLTTDERVTAFPAVAGDIVFFTTTTTNQIDSCAAPSANLYAFTFIGGAAYDNTGDNTVTSKDTPLVKTVAGQRATAPFIVDQHLAFAAGSNVQLFGDPTAYNNGVGQAGVRILSWREVR